MSDVKRADEIKRSITAFSEGQYAKKDLLLEMLKLQDEIVALTFGKTVDDKNRPYRIYDVAKYYEKQNATHHNVADAQLKRFKADCRNLDNLIKAEISGNKGERIVLNSLNAVHCYNRLLNNIELRDGDDATEIDAIMITSKAIFIIEIKNCKKDVSITEDGRFYKNGDYYTFDCNIRDKMQKREDMITKALNDAGIRNVNIVKIVTFTNEKITVKNRCKDIEVCFAGDLHRAIYGCRWFNMYSSERIDEIADVIESSKYETNFKYSDIDAEKVKNDYADLVVKLENAKESEQTEQDVGYSENEKKVRWNKFGIAASVAASLAIITVIPGLIALRPKS